VHATHYLQQTEGAADRGRGFDWGPSGLARAREWFLGGLYLWIWHWSGTTKPRRDHLQLPYDRWFQYEDNPVFCTPLSFRWVKQALQGAGLVEQRRRRERRPLPGVLLHIDGSQHRWLNDDRWYDLIVILDDATSEIY